MAKTSETDPIFANLVDISKHASGRIGKYKIQDVMIYSIQGMTFAPGKNQDRSSNGWTWRRSVDLDLEHLNKTYNCTVLVSLMQEFEYKSYKNESLFEKVTIKLFIDDD